MSGYKKHLFFCEFETTLVYVVLGQPDKILSQKRKERPIWKYQYYNISEIIFLYLFQVRIKIFHSYFVISVWVGDYATEVMWRSENNLVELVLFILL